MARMGLIQIIILTYFLFFADTIKNIAKLKIVRLKLTTVRKKRQLTIDKEVPTSFVFTCHLNIIQHITTLR